jgi:hypothetical protein
MADITKSSDPGITNPEYQSPLTAQAGVELAACDAVYLDADGKLQKAVRPTVFISGSFGVHVKFAGLTARAIPSGTYGEVYGRGAEFYYADSGLNEGTPVFPSATAGNVADAAVAATDQPWAVVVSTTNIRLIDGV